MATSKHSDTTPAQSPVIAVDADPIAAIRAAVAALNDEVLGLPAELSGLVRYAALAVAQEAEKIVGLRDTDKKPLADQLIALAQHMEWENATFRDAEFRKAAGLVSDLEAVAGTA